MNIDDLRESAAILILIAIIIISIKIIYFISLHCKIHNIEYDLEEANKKLERIANALEQDTEPYVIEKRETDS